MLDLVKHMQDVHPEITCLPVEQQEVPNDKLSIVLRYGLETLLVRLHYQNLEYLINSEFRN